MAQQVSYSDQQKEILSYSRDQLLIRGIAGSGKTLMLLEKAKDVAQKYPNETVAIFSYGNPLSVSAKKQLGPNIPPNITVMTFHSWAMKNYYKTFGMTYTLEKFPKRKFINAIKEVGRKHPSHRFITNKHLHDFVREEIGWMKGCDLCEFTKYDKAQRKGRGGKIRVSADDKKVIYQIFEAYQKQLGSHVEFDDFGLLMSRDLSKIPDISKFDHVFIDEAQDLTKVNLMVLTHIARKSCIVGADKGQKIFATSFTWESVGLNIKGGRTKTLRDSYRTTKQIMELAYSIQEKDEISKDEEFTRPALPVKQGPKPTLFISRGTAEQDRALVEAVSLIRRESPESTVGILYRHYEYRVRIEQLLNRSGVEYQVIQSASKERDIEKIGSHHEPGVKLTSFHTAKGLEFKYVLIPDMVDPETQVRLGDDFDWDLERRLFYVAMTRAEMVLQIFTYGDRHTLVDELNRAHYDRVML